MRSHINITKAATKSSLTVQEQQCKKNQRAMNELKREIQKSREMLALQEKKVREIEEVGRQLQPLQEEYRRQVSFQDSQKGQAPPWKGHGWPAPTRTNQQEPLNNDIGEVNQIVR